MLATLRKWEKTGRKFSAGSPSKQCQYVTKHDSTSYLCCGLLRGHPGPHAICYDLDRVWMTKAMWEKYYLPIARLMYRHPPKIETKPRKKR